MNDRAKALFEDARNWEGVTVEDRDGSEVAFVLGRREVGHLHEDALHVPFPRSVRDELIEEGEADAHPFNPDTGWVEVPLESSRDRARGHDVLRRSYEIAREANSKKQD